MSIGILLSSHDMILGELLVDMLKLYGLVGLALLFAAGVILGISLMVVVLEAVVLHQIKWDSLKHSLVDSGVVNLITTLIGFWTAMPKHHSTGSWQRWISLFLASAVIEGGLLLIVRNKSPRKTFTAAFAANTVSYLMLIVIVPLARTLIQATTGETLRFLLSV